MAIKIWVFVALANLFGNDVQLAEGIKYAFPTETACKAVIRDNPRLRCVELELVAWP